jgi:hypothetical protein
MRSVAISDPDQFARFGFMAQADVGIAKTWLAASADG